MNEKFYSCSPEEFIKNARMPVRVMETEAAMYEEIAEIMASTIENKKAAKQECWQPFSSIAIRLLQAHLLKDILWNDVLVNHNIHSLVLYERT